MSDRFIFDDEFCPVPAEAVDADPAKTMRELLYRVSRLEQTLEEERAQGLADTKEFLLELLSLSDDITAIVDRWGVTTKANEAAIIRTVVALGRKLLEILKHHQVAAISVVGKPFDPKTSEVAEIEVRENAPAGTVLREVQVGYTWPHGILRKARVIVSHLPESAEEGESAPEIPQEPEGQAPLAEEPATGEEWLGADDDSPSTRDAAPDATERDER